MKNTHIIPNQEKPIGNFCQTIYAFSTNESLYSTHESINNDTEFLEAISFLNDLGNLKSFRIYSHQDKVCVEIFLENQEEKIDTSIWYQC